jgi:hypothetical protein
VAKSHPTRRRIVLIESLIAVACGIGFWWVAHERLARAHMLDPWNTADMVDYCNAILHLGTDPDTPWSMKRSKITGLFAAFFAQDRGIMSGLRASSAVATCLIGGGLYLWARITAGRTAGLLAAIAGLALSPLVLLPRILTFYPMVSAAFVLGAVGVTAGIVSRHPRALALAGAGIGLALLSDVRGLVWAVPWSVGGLIALWRSANRKQAVMWLAGPLIVSFALARLSFPAGAVSFEAQIDARPLWQLYGSTDPAHQPPHDSGGDFVWGRSAPWKLPQTGLFVLHQLTLDPPEHFPPPVSRFAVDNHLSPMVPVWIGAGLLALGGLIRRPRAALALAVTVAPFAIAFHGQHGMAEIRLRFMSQILPALAVLIGVGLGRVIDGLPGPMRAYLGQSHPARTLVAGGTALVFVLGMISSPVSSRARWRRPWPVVGELVLVHPDTPNKAQLSPRMQTCASALQRDEAAGHWIPRRRRH